MENLYESKKFWIIWFSCLGAPKTVKEIHESWDYSEGSKALYQPAGAGHEKSIAQEMVDKGYLSVEREVQRRGATAKKLFAKTDWYTELIKEELDSEIKEDYLDAVKSSYPEFSEAMKDLDFRHTAFRLSALKEAFSSKRDVSKDKKLLPLYIYINTVLLRVSIDYIEDDMPFSFEKVFGAGLINLEDMASNVVEKSFSLSDYLTEEYGLNGPEELAESLPESSVESELYSRLYKEFGNKMSDISELLG